MIDVRLGTDTPFLDPVLPELVSPRHSCLAELAGGAHAEHRPHHRDELLVVEGLGQEGTGLWSRPRVRSSPVL